MQKVLRVFFALLFLVIYGFVPNLFANDQVGFVRNNANGTKSFVLDMNGNTAWDSGTDLAVKFGETSDVTVIGDFNGDGQDDVGLVRHLANGSKKWIFDLNNNLQWDTGTDLSGFFGSDTDTQVIGDWNGDGKDDIALVRHLPNGSKKFIFDMNNNLQWDSGIDRAGFFGSDTDTAIVGDWNGDGNDEIGVVRNKTDGTKVWILDMNGNATWDSGTDLVASLGESTDTHIIGDWNGDGTDDIGLVRHLPNGSKKWIFDMNNNLAWDSDTDLSGFFGSDSDGQVVGDWNGDGQDDIALIRHLPNGSKKWIFDMDNNLQWDSGTDQTGFFGSATDIVIVGTWTGGFNPDGLIQVTEEEFENFGGEGVWRSIGEMSGDFTYTYEMDTYESTVEFFRHVAPVAETMIGGQRHYDQCQLAGFQPAEYGEPEYCDGAIITYYKSTDELTYYMVESCEAGGTSVYEFTQLSDIPEFDLGSAAVNFTNYDDVSTETGICGSFMGLEQQYELVIPGLEDPISIDSADHNITVRVPYKDNYLLLYFTLMEQPQVDVEYTFGAYPGSSFSVQSASGYFGATVDDVAVFSAESGTLILTSLDETSAGGNFEAVIEIGDDDFETISGSFFIAIE